MRVSIKKRHNYTTKIHLQTIDQQYIIMYIYVELNIYVPIVTNINFLLTVSIDCQGQSL